MPEVKVRRQGNRRRGAAMLLCVLVTGALLSGGCGGSGGSKQPTRSAIDIRFDFSRASSTAKLPDNAHSVKLTVVDSNEFQDFRVLNRPTDPDISEVVAEFFALSPGQANLNVQAFSGQNGTGDVLAVAGLQTQLSLSGNNRPDIVFNPVYSHIVLTKGGTDVGATESILQDGTLTLVATGRTDNNIVSVSNVVGTWTSSNQQVASVSAGGVVTGLLPGTAVITFTDAASSQRKASVSVVVQGGSVEVPVN